MSTLDEGYALTDEDREVLALDIKDMDNETFESYSKKLSILLKEKSREVLAKKEEEDKLKADKAEEAKKTEVKASTEESEDSAVIETAVEDAQEEDSEDIPNSSTAEEETLVQRHKKAFTLDQFEIK